MKKLTILGLAFLIATTFLVVPVMADKTMDQIEKAGKIKKVNRTPTNQRFYTESDIDEIQQFVLKLWLTTLNNGHDPDSLDIKEIISGEAYS